MGRTFKEMAYGLVKPFAEADITDVAAKRWTYLCEIRVTEGYLAQPFRVKLKVSRRPAPKYESELRLITSTTTPVQALGNVATLVQLFQDKQDCIASRAAQQVGQERRSRKSRQEHLRSCGRTGQGRGDSGTSLLPVLPFV